MEDSTTSQKGATHHSVWTGTPSSPRGDIGESMARSFRRFRRLVPWAVAAFLGCDEGGLDDPSPGMKAFWQQIHLDRARDLGHIPRRLASIDAIPAGPIRFEDASSRAGLGGAIGIGNTQGVGLAFVDLNGDRLPDLFVANGQIPFTERFDGSRLYLNDGQGGFDEGTEASGLKFLSGKDAYSVAAGDYDNDGDIDLYVATHPNDILLKNDGAANFVDATIEASAGGPVSSIDRARQGRSKIAAFGDYNADGLLDIAVASSTLDPPYAYLLENRGDGTFKDVTEQTGVKADRNGNPCAMMWSDYDNDSDPDLWIWNDFGDHILLRNEDNSSFSDVTSPSGLANLVVTNPMGIDAADIDHDGDLDYYISNAGNNPLLINNGDGTFTDATREAGTGGEFGWGLAMDDFDADGWADLFVTQEDELPILVFRNERETPPKFTRLDIERTPVLDQFAARNTPAAFADYDVDGRVDAIVARTDGSPLALYRNVTELGSHRWLHVEVSRAPRSGDRGSIGARIGVKTGDLVQFRDVTGGSSRGSQNELLVHFGLGDWSGAEWVAVLWPSGEQSVIKNVEGNQRVVIDPP